jgi:hypothetical protein
MQHAQSKLELGSYACAGSDSDTGNSSISVILVGRLCVPPRPPRLAVGSLPGSHF